MANNYHEQRRQKNLLQLKTMTSSMPRFTAEFFRGIADQTTPLTRTNYAKDLRLFFEFVTENEPELYNREITSLTVEDLEKVSVESIEEFMEFTTFYKSKQGLSRKNDENGKSRKLAAIRTLFGYFYKKRRIKSNPSELVGFPKTHDKAIVRLDANEVSELLDAVEKGTHLSEHQRNYHKLTKLRDVAIITLMLGTGIRISECVGIDLEHIDFRVRGIKIIRKGGNEAIIYFGDEVEEALRNYISERQKSEALPEHKNALFLSIQKKRISDRAIEMLVKKYSEAVIAFKRITPHKFRSTYGTSLYRQTGDIYLVASILGHSDVNTTRKHYADMDEERKRNVVNAVKLR